MERTTTSRPRQVARLLHLVVMTLTLGPSMLAAGARPDKGQSLPLTHLSLGGSVPVIKTESQLRTFLDDLEAQRFLIATGLSIETYHQWLGKPNHLAATYTRLSNQLLGRRDYAAVIERWKGKVKDPTLARRLEVQQTDFLAAKVEPRALQAFGDSQVKLQDSVLGFRYLLGGKKVTMTQLGEVCQLEPDREKRRSAFLTFQQGAKAHRAAILKCMKSNDTVGRAEGFRSGAEASLNLQGLTRAQVLRDLEQFEVSTRPVMLSLLAAVKRDLKVDKAQIWDLDYWLHLKETEGGANPYSSDAGVSRLNELMKAIGCEPEKRMITVTVRDVPVGGIAFATRPPFESRLLTNPFSGSGFYFTLFHEYGHALNGVLANPKLPPGLLGADPAPMTEGIAEFFGHYALDRHWLVRATGVSPDRAEQLERIGKLQILLWLRRTICMNSWVELRAYDNLNADLDALYEEGFRKFTRCDLPRGRFFGLIDMYGTTPLYLTSYLYASMVATQLRDAMKKEFRVEDLSAEPRVGPWVTKHIFFPGLSTPWSKKIRQSTGKPLGTESLSHFLSVVIPSG